MTGKVSSEILRLPQGDTCFQITMLAPRANALEPEILKDLHKAFDALELSGVRKALISGGRNFSSGGDVQRFYDAARKGAGQRYADQVVPPLQDLIMRMIKMPVLFASAVCGAATGGAAGLVFASDIVVTAPSGFVQPYYNVTGFAPDGGWTALLPDLIGCGPARAWLLTNQRYGAVDLVYFGLAQAVDENPKDKALDLLEEADIGAALAAKSLLWSPDRIARTRAGLNRETEKFKELIERPQTLERMNTFLRDSA